MTEDVLLIESGECTEETLPGNCKPSLMDSWWPSATGNENSKRKCSGDWMNYEDLPMLEALGETSINDQNLPLRSSATTVAASVTWLVAAHIHAAAPAIKELSRTQEMLNKGRRKTVLSLIIPLKKHLVLSQTTPSTSKLLPTDDLRCALSTLARRLVSCPLPMLVT